MQLAELTTNLHFHRQLVLEIKDDKTSSKRYIEDSLYHLSFPAEAVISGSSEIFTANLESANGKLESRNMPLRVWNDNIEDIDNSCKQLLAVEDSKVASDYLKSDSTIKTHDTITPYFFK